MPTIRPAARADLPALQAISNHYIEHSVTNFKTVPLDAESFCAWFGMFSEDGPYRLLVAQEDGAILGYAATIEFNSRAAYSTSAAVSIYLHPDKCRAGVGTELYAALFKLLEDSGLHRLYAGITVPNEASIALHTKMGFREAARYTEVGRKFDRWLDVVWMEREFP